MVEIFGPDKIKRIKIQNRYIQILEKQTQSLLFLALKNPARSHLQTVCNPQDWKRTILTPLIPHPVCCVASVVILYLLLQYNFANLLTGDSLIVSPLIHIEMGLTFKTKALSTNLFGCFVSDYYCRGMVKFQGSNPLIFLSLLYLCTLILQLYKRNSCQGHRCTNQ